MSVTIKNLTVKNEDFYFDGDLRLVGNTFFENASLTVTGNLILAVEEIDNEYCKPTLEIINGNLTAKSLEIMDSLGYYAGCCGTGCCDYFSVENGDIHITKGSLLLGDTIISNICNLYVEDGDLICGDICCSHSIYVEGTITSYGGIHTLFDLYCYNGDFDGPVVCERDMYVASRCDLNGNILIVRKSFETSIFINVDSIKIGK